MAPPPENVARREAILRGEAQLGWLHIPKTGTSFGNTLISWACPELPARQWMAHSMRESYMNLDPACRARFRPPNFCFRDRLLGCHESLTNRSQAELRNVFTLLRSPRTRVVAGYHQWFVTGDARRTHPGHVHASAEEICALARTSNHSVMAPGAMVRMVLGDPLGKGYFFTSAAQPSLAQADAACARLRQFAFVGLTERWNATVCLFHAMHGGRAHAYELANVRPGVYVGVANAVREADCGDHADERLFECAQQLFNQRLRQYPQCAQHVAEVV